MAKSNKKNTAQKLVLSDTEKRQKKTSAKSKRAALAGKNFDDLKAGEKDALLKSLLESSGYIDATGIVL